MEHPFSQFKYCPKCGSVHFEINNEKSKRCADCEFVYYFNPSAATVALIMNERNELLVCRRAKDPAKGTLDLPGGFIDMAETGEEGVSREVNIYSLCPIYMCIPVSPSIPWIYSSAVQ